MLKTYFRLAWRHLGKNKGYTFINIAGLATGMAIALIIGFWIADELTFDHYYTNHSRLAKGMITQSANGESFTGDYVSIPMGQALRTQYPDLFSRVASVSQQGNHLITFADVTISGQGVWTQHEFPEMFTFRMIQGSTAAFNDPSATLISQSIATALFGNDSPINKTVRVDNKHELRIVGVYEDLPDNVTYSGVKILLPWTNNANSYLNSNTGWTDHNSQLFVELTPNTNPEQATARIRNLLAPHIKGWLEEGLIYPLDKAHLYNEFKNGKAGGRILFVRLFTIIGIFILLLACINFMNLSTARSEIRAKEVGIRKTVGSLRKQLIVQFLSESILVAILAFALALILTTLTLPFFNALAAKQMSIPWQSSLFWAAALAFLLITGLLAGSYPAFYLSGFDPVRVLKGSIRSGRNASLPRQVLVVLQFSVSLTLIIGTIIVFRQIQTAKDRPLGYSRDGLLSVWINTAELKHHYEAIRTELLSKGLVENIAESSQPITNFNNNNELDWRGKRPDQATLFFRNVNVSPDFGNTIGWTIAQGRDFSRDFATDSNAMILNEAAVQAMNIGNVVGESVKLFGKKYTVIGVVKDMVTNSPYDKVEPAMFAGDPWFDVITLRIKPGMAMSKALAGLEPVFKKYNPGSPFLYRFSDDDYARKFETEQRIGNLASVFTSLAIFISCLGLFGLASFVAEQRTKEIGIRKVLGARVFTLWGLLSKEFLKLVTVSLIISIPLSWFCMNQWLQNYTYHTSLSWWIFASASLGILLITLLTVSYQALRAATMNPIKSLRSE